MWVQTKLIFTNVAPRQLFKLNVVNVPQRWLLGVSDGTYTWSFFIQTPREGKKFKQILCYMVGFECPHHLMVSPPWYFSIGPRHLPNFWGKKTKATTNVILTSHQLDLPLFLICSARRLSRDNPARSARLAADSPSPWPEPLTVPYPPLDWRSCSQDPSTFPSCPAKWQIIKYIRKYCNWNVCSSVKLAASAHSWRHGFQRHPNEERATASIFL